MYGALVDLLPYSAIDILLPINLTIIATADQCQDGQHGRDRDRNQGQSPWCQQSCLLVVRGDTIEVYARQTKTVVPKDDTSLSTGVMLLARQRLAARILEADRLPSASLENETTGGTGDDIQDDKLLLAFANHHYAILFWERRLREWRTCSLHSFGHKTLVSDQGIAASAIDPLLTTDNPRVAPLMTTSAEMEPSSTSGRRLAVDPEGRCVLLKTQTAWALLPLTDAESTHAHSRSRLIESLDERVRRTIDMAFLPGYMEPTLVLLYEPHPTWPYRLPLTKDTLCLLIISLDMTAGTDVGGSGGGKAGAGGFGASMVVRPQVRTTAIAHYTGIASDARSLHVHSTGLFLAGANTLVHIDPGNPTMTALALNSYATSRMTGLKRNVALRLTMERPCWFTVGKDSGRERRRGRGEGERSRRALQSKSSSRAVAPLSKTAGTGIGGGGPLLVVADDGRLYECSIVHEKATVATAAGRRIDLKPCTQASLTSLSPIRLICRFAEDAICIVPPVGDATIHLEPQGGGSRAGGDEAPHQHRPAYKSPDPNYQGTEDEDEDIYGERVTPEAAMPVESLATAAAASTVLGRLTVLAPLADLCVGGQPSVGTPPSTSASSSASGPLELALALGNSDTGQLVLCKNHLPVRATALFTISASQAVYGLGDHRYLVATENSIVLVQAAPGTPVRELGPGALLPVRTLLAGPINDSRSHARPSQQPLLQVTSAAIRVLSADASQVVLEAPFASYSPPKEAKLADTLLVVQHEDGLITAYNVRDLTPVELGRPLTAITAWDLLDHPQDNSVILTAIDTRGALAWLELVNTGRDGDTERNANDMDLDSKAPPATWTVASHATLTHTGALPVYLSNQVSSEQDGSVASFEFDDTSLVGGVNGIGLLRNDWDDLFMIFASSGTAGLVAYQLVPQPQQGMLLFKRLALPSHVLANHVGGSSLVKLHRSRLSDTAQPMVLAHSPASSTTRARTWIIGTDQLGALAASRVHLPEARRILSVSRDELGIYDGPSGTYQVLTLEPDWHLDARHWPHRRMALPGCPRSIAYHSPSDTLAVVVVQPRPFPALPRDEYTAIADNEMPSLPTDALPPQQSMHKLVLLRRGAVIDSYEMGEDELILCLTSATLETKQTASGRQPFLVLGTSVCRGEDRPARGRVLVFDVISVVAEEGHPEATDCRLKLLASEEMKGPVTALTHIGGALAVALGSKVIIHAFERNESLTGVAFIDAGVYGAALCSLRSFFALGDVSKSVALFAYQERPPKVVALARDYASRPVLACEWLVEGARGEAILVTGDAMGVLRLYSYDPMAPGSEGGMRLLGLGALCIGDDTMRLRRLVLAQGGVTAAAGTGAGGEGGREGLGGAASNHACLVVGVSGAVRALCPVDEGIFRRLYGLQLRLAASLLHLGGVTSRAAWQYQPISSRPEPLPHMLLDGACLLRLYELPPAAQGHLLALVRLSRETGHSLIDTLISGLYTLF